MLKKNNTASIFNNLKNNRFSSIFNKFANSPFATIFWTISALICHIFSIELVFYAFICSYAILVIVLSDNLLPLMPVFVFCYIVPSLKNNPGIVATSIFYGASGISILLMAISVFVALFIRIAVDKNIGFKKFFLQKRSLTVGMLAIGVAYILSGIGRPNYFEIFKNNLVCSLVQFVSIFLLYFIFTGAVNWKKTPKNYFAWLGICMGLLVSAELLHIYIIKGVIQNGSINRSLILTGWGHYNNMGAIIAMSIPFAFYMASKTKHNYIFLIIATTLLAFLILSCSRGSIVCGTIIFIISLIVTFLKAENKKTFRISTISMIILAIILMIIFKNSLINLFKNVPTIINQNSESLSFNDSSRFNIYKKGFDAFLQFPILGQSFYPFSYVPYGFSTIESFNNFLPPRWHNTIIQILATCGIVGIVAYTIHRYQTIKLFVKKPSLEKTFIGLSILTLLLMSLLDCHFFNIGPTLIYSMGLAFAEKINYTEE